MDTADTWGADGWRRRHALEAVWILDLGKAIDRYERALGLPGVTVAELVAARAEVSQAVLDLSGQFRLDELRAELRKLAREAVDDYGDHRAAIEDQLDQLALRARALLTELSGRNAGHVPSAARQLGDLIAEVDRILAGERAAGYRENGPDTEEDGRFLGPGPADPSTDAFDGDDPSGGGWG